jgi:hypothetical protein
VGSPASSDSVLRSSPPQRSGPPRAAWLCLTGLCLSTLALLTGGISRQPLPAGAELPPWVYSERQRTAPLRLTLHLEERRRLGERLQGRARILAVVRQPSGSPLQTGQRIGLQLPLPSPRQPGFGGPAPVTLPERGSRFEAWLAPLPGQPGWYAPAAGGYSFGPSLEEQREPGP